MGDPRMLGRWQLHEELGEGGNAVVYRATSDGQEVALKVLKTNRADKEPYQRFVHEIATLLGLADTTGILPVLDSYLPERPSKTDRPWLAMPIATTLDKALRDEPLEVVVTAVQAVASTLARLHGEGIAHRDVKPTNLYRWVDQWLVGDFGLVRTPDPSGLTLPNRPLGPAHFMAHEMLANPQTADPMPAEVLSLAKTLWVLARNERYPLAGHQRANNRGFGVGDARPHSNASILDDLIAGATSDHPEDRPTMAALAFDLREWLALTPDEDALDLGDLPTRFRAKIEATLADQYVAEQRKEMALIAVRRLTELLRPLNRALGDLHPRAAIDGAPDEFTRNVVRTREYGGTPQIAFRYQRLSHITLDEGGRDFSLRFARSLELNDVGALIVHFVMLVGPTRTMGGLRFQWMPDAWTAPVGSVEVEQMLRTAVREATAQLRAAAEAFVEGAA